MNVLIVYATQLGTTEHVARVMAESLSPAHSVRVLEAHDARAVRGDGVDLLLVGTPTQFHGLRLLVRPFLRDLRSRGFAGVAAATFDTRAPGAGSGAAAPHIATALEAAGCRMVMEPVGFLISNVKGELANGEEARARAWALDVAGHVARVTDRLAAAV